MKYSLLRNSLSSITPLFLLLISLGKLMLCESIVRLKISLAFEVLSVIRQKGESQNGCFKKAKHAKISKKKHFLPPDTHTYVCVSGGKTCLFFGNFGVLCFLETPVLRFALLPYYRRIVLVGTPLKLCFLQHKAINALYFSNFPCLRGNQPFFDTPVYT